MGFLGFSGAAEEQDIGTQRLGFEEFFHLPVGAEGLEFSARLIALQGQRVTVEGYMVEEQVEEAHGHGTPTWAGPVERRFMLTATPQTINSSHYGPCDGLPPQVMYVHVADAPAAPLRHRAGLLRVTGRLEVGAWREADERISQVRLRLEAGSIFSASAQAQEQGGEIKELESRTNNNVKK